MVFISGHELLNIIVRHVQILLITLDAASAVFISKTGNKNMPAACTKARKWRRPLSKNKRLARGQSFVFTFVQRNDPILEFSMQELSNPSMAWANQKTSAHHQNFEKRLEKNSFVYLLINTARRLRNRAVDGSH